MYKRQTLDDKREKMQDAFAELEDHLVQVFEFYKETGRFPWNVEGFMPQDHKNKENDFITI